MQNREDNESAHADRDQGGRSAPPVARPLGVPLARPVTVGNPMLLANIKPLRAALHLVALVVTFGIYVVFVSVAADLAGAPPDVDLDPLTNLLVTACGGVVLVMMTLLLLREAGAKPQAIGLTGRKLVANLAWGLPVAAGSFGAFFVTVVVMSLLWPAGYDQLLDNPQRIKEMIPRMHGVWLCLLMVGICAYEEVVFRGVLLTHVRRMTKSWTAAVVISAAIFSLLHVGEGVGGQETAACIPLFATAVVWSLFTIRTRSLVPAMSGHFLFNMVQLVNLEHYAGSAAAAPS